MVENDNGGILPAEQVAELREKYPAPKTPAERKQAQRTRDKEKAKVKAAMSQADTIQQFWEESRKLIDPTKLTVWKVRGEEVEAQLGAMREAMEGRAPDELYIDDVDRDTRNMLREYGECGATPILLIGRFWQDPILLAKLTSGETPSAIFAKFGIIVALPDLRIHQWTHFINSLRGTASSVPTWGRVKL